MTRIWNQESVLHEMAGHRFGSRVQCFDRLESTNDNALELMEKGAPEGSLILAEEQTRGRGRRERLWESPPRLGIYASLVLLPRIPARWLPLVSLAFAVGGAAALRAAGLHEVGLKWPNDILLGDRKVAGILAEARGDGEIRGLVVGLGLNVNQGESDFPAALRKTATSLRLSSGLSWDRLDILKGVLLQCEEEYDELQEKGPEGLLRRFEEHCVFSRGTRLEVESANRVWGGRFAGLGSSGELLLDTDGATPESFLFGEVRRVKRA